MKKRLFFIMAYNLNTMNVDNVGFDYTKEKALKRMKNLKKDKNYCDFYIMSDTIDFS